MAPEVGVSWPASRAMTSQRECAGAAEHGERAVHFLEHVCDDLQRGRQRVSPDATTLYSAFNTAVLTTPAPTPNGATLLISDPKSLAIKLGINLPEAIVGKR